MAEWTRDMVEDRIVEAAKVLRQLPGPRAQGYFSTWPDILLSAREIARQAPKPMKVLPSPQAISRMEEVITWNRHLERDDANLLWARAEGLPWKEICYRFGISRPTAHRRHEYALSVIAWRLSGRQVNRKRGMSFMIARARG
jgi:hypothetical protein